jgi:deoxyribodipyrimidine photolyase-related protein
MKKTAIVLYPHQLYRPDTSWFKKELPIYLIEESLFLTEFPIHRQKLLLHRLSLQAYYVELKQAGFEVEYQSLHKESKTGDVFELLKRKSFTDVIIADTTDNWLEKRIEEACLQNQLVRHKEESPLFILEAEEARVRYVDSGKHMANFYKKLRRDKNILVNRDKEPEGGQWSFDEDNRKKIPKGTPLPSEIEELVDNDEITKAKDWLSSLTNEQYGTDKVWIPYTRHDAHEYLKKFIKERLVDFGTYEDAILSHHTRIFHSTLSPLINIGLLTPESVIQAVIKHQSKFEVDINNIEGFVRQVLGWREFIRAAYEVDGTKMRNSNFFKHQKPLPEFFWDGETDITPLKQCLYSTLNYGYNHHIERLMVLGNFLLLNRTDPNEVYKWFMCMYVDAYDWVMVPNVYGMSQFADGGIFATKPYISGSNYLKKMSDYEAGPWEDLLTALYWQFIEDNSEMFLKNHRLSMMPKLLTRLAPEKRQLYKNLAREHLHKE